MLYWILGFITWLIIFVVVWHDYKTKQKSFDNLRDVITSSGLVGGIMSLLWPLLWIMIAMIYLFRGVSVLYIWCGKGVTHDR